MPSTGRMTGHIVSTAIANSLTLHAAEVSFTGGDDIRMLTVNTRTLIAEE